jgi:uncharacterized protein (DUF58 family)
MNLRVHLPERMTRWLKSLPWAKLKARDNLPFEITHRRIYVLPTGFGLFVGLSLAVLNLGALNYNNNAALLLGFIIISACNNSLIVSHLSLLGLRVQFQTVEPVFAGQYCVLPFSISSSKTSRHQRSVFVMRFQNHSTELSLSQEINSAHIKIPALKRGLFDINKLELFTLQPLGLAKAWSTISLRERVLIYPTPRGHSLQNNYMAADGVAGGQTKQMTDQPHHIREFKTGDSRRQIAWKASARTGNLQVREYESAQSEQLVLDWHTLQALPYEQKIEQLCLWVMQADQKNLSYALHLPDKKIAYDTGNAHKKACLEALALMPYE